MVLGPPSWLAGLRSHSDIGVVINQGETLQRAGEIKGILDRRLQGKEIKILCLEEAESVDVEPAMAALANLPISSVVMVGDKLQRVENKSRKRKRDVKSGYGDELSSANNADSFRVARDGVDGDGEEDVHDHGSRDTLASSRPVPATTAVQRRMPYSTPLRCFV